MADETQTQTDESGNAETGQIATASGDDKATPKGLDALIQKLPLPPKYRTRKYVLGGVGALLALIVIWVQCNAAGGSGPDETLPAPVAAPAPTPEPTAIPREEYQLPRQYAFVHFVNEMAGCYDQNGQVATLEAVEADIMADVPSAVATLMGLYAANRCEEAEPWHQIPGRIGWMLRASGLDPGLPEPEEDTQ